jgi:hypothetical protein
MPVAQSPAHYINTSKGCPSFTESFPLCYLLVLCATVAALPVVEPHSVSHTLMQFSISHLKANSVSHTYKQYGKRN